MGRAPQALIVAGPGNAKFDLAATGDRPQHFYIWNSLGLAPSTGLGLALAQPERQVIVLDGDGGTLMNPGALVTTARLAPPKLLHIVWDNGQYQLTGGQPTATATVTDLAAMGRGAGLQHVAAVATISEFETGLETWLTEPGPWLVVAKIDDSPAPAHPRIRCGSNCGSWKQCPPYLASNCKHAKFATVFPRYKQQGVDFHE